MLQKGIPKRVDHEKYDRFRDVYIDDAVKSAKAKASTNVV
jgi:hypothetical protein